VVILTVIIAPYEHAVKLLRDGMRQISYYTNSIHWASSPKIIISTSKLVVIDEGHHMFSKERA
jgi:hypothetical protein